MTTIFVRPEFYFDLRNKLIKAGTGGLIDDHAAEIVMGDVTLKSEKNALYDKTAINAPTSKDKGMGDDGYNEANAFRNQGAELLRRQRDSDLRALAQTEVKDGK